MKARPQPLAFIVILGFLSFAQSQTAYPDLTKTYDTVKVADGIYAFIAPESMTSLVSGNSIAIIGDDGVLVVDSTTFPSLAKRMIADIQRLTDKPVRFLVNTHWHPDHFSGNGVYREKYPDAVILSTASTRDQIETAGRPYEDPKPLEASAPRLQAMLSSGKDPSGNALNEADVEMVKRLIADRPNVIAEKRQIKHTPPSMTFEKQVDIYLGKRKVQVMFLGRGNTEGDAVVYVPDSKVLITGDLLVNPTPYGLGSFFNEWIVTLKQLQSMDAMTIIPGHGPVEHDKEYLGLVIRLLQTTVDQVQQAFKQGLSLEETQKKVDLEEYRKKMTNGNPHRERAFDYFFAIPGIERVYREAKEGPLHDEK